MFIEGLVIVFVGLLAYQYLIWNFQYWKKRKVPSHKPWPLLGSLPNNIIRQRNVTYDIEDIYREFKGSTPFVGIFQIRKPALLLLEPTVVKSIMIQNFKHFQNNGFSGFFDKDVDKLFSRNPFFLEGDEWKAKRAEITPAFTPNRVKALYPLIEDVTNKLKKYILAENTKNTQEPFDARELCAKYTTDVVSNCVFAVDAESFTKENPEIRAAGKKLFEPSLRSFFIFTIAFVMPAIQKIMKFKLVPQDVEDFFVNLMDQALKHRKDNKIDRDDYLGYLISLQQKKQLQPIDMAAHALSFFTDGFETSSVALSHVLYELGNNTRVQEKLRQEIIDTLAKKKEITFETLNEMPYLDQVFNESLRMHSPITFTARACNEPIEIEGHKGHKVLIEKGMDIIIPVNELHYDPEIYDNPKEFCPERFDEDKGGVKLYMDKCVFLPFGNGPRICLGMRFALAQTKAAMVEIVNNFQISVNKKTQRPLIIDPKEFLNIKTGGLWLDLKSIE